MGCNTKALALVGMLAMGAFVLTWTFHRLGMWLGSRRKRQP